MQGADLIEKLPHNLGKTQGREARRRGWESGDGPDETEHRTWNHLDVGDWGSQSQRTE